MTCTRVEERKGEEEKERAKNKTKRKAVPPGDMSTCRINHRLLTSMCVSACVYFFRNSFFLSPLSFRLGNIVQHVLLEYPLNMERGRGTFFLVGFIRHALQPLDSFLVSC